MNEVEYQDYIETTYNAKSEISDLFDPQRRMFTIDGKPFVILSIGLKPIRIHVRCDEQLGKKLIAEYNTVMAGHDLDPKEWISVVASGEMDEEGIKDLIRAAYHLIVGKLVS